MDLMTSKITNSFACFRETGCSEALANAEKASLRALKLGMVVDPGGVRLIAQVFEAVSESEGVAPIRTNCEGCANVCRMNRRIRMFRELEYISAELCKSAICQPECYDTSCLAHPELTAQLATSAAELIRNAHYIPSKGCE